MRQLLNLWQDRRAQRARERRLLCFMHIPKTAGTSLVEALRANFDDAACVRVDGPESLPDLRPRQMQRRYDLMHGHMGWDVARPVASDIFTVLRDPIDRILSLYNYWRIVAMDGVTIFEGGLVDPAVTMARDLSFDDFVRSGHRRILHDIANGQSFQVASAHNDLGWAALDGWSEDRVFDRAMANITAMSAAGVVDNLPHFIDQLQTNLGLDVALRHTNATAVKTVTRDALSEATLDHLRELTRIDTRLYEALRERCPRP